MVFFETWVGCRQTTPCGTKDPYVGRGEGGHGDGGATRRQEEVGVIEWGDVVLDQVMHPCALP